MSVDLSKHDPTKPYTAEEVRELQNVFRTLPTFTDTGDGKGFISTSDIPSFLIKVSVESTPEKNAEYKKYFDAHFEGVIPMDEMVRISSAWHDTVLLAKQRVKVYDLDGNGFIDRHEFEAFLQLCKTHEPKLAELSYAEFLRMADANKDGKVSIEEFGNWLQATLQQ